MTDIKILFLTLAVHELLCAAVLLRALSGKHHFNAAHYIWMELIPVFGPIAALAMVRSLGGRPPDEDWLNLQEEKHHINYMVRSKAEYTVPLEEALLMNDPQKRRNLMMNVLRSDPMRYLDLLLVARNNDDSETAHYATASIMEIQRQFQLELQKFQREIVNNEGKFEAHQQYISLLSRYCESGLLEGQLLSREQLILKGALNRALALENDPAILRIKVVNSLKLKEADEAKKTAMKLIELYPKDENSWLEGMRVYAETRDKAGMQDLLARIQDARVDFTASGREHMNFFKGLLA